MDCPDSFSYDVYYRAIKGFSFEKCMNNDQSEAIKKGFDKALDYLINEKKVSGISGDCGFMMYY